MANKKRSVKHKKWDRHVPSDLPAVSELTLSVPVAGYVVNFQLTANLLLQVFMLGIQHLGQSSADISKYVQKAEKALQKGRLKAALSEYLRVLRLDPANAGAKESVIEEDVKLAWANDLKQLGYQRVVFLRGLNRTNVSGLRILPEPQATQLSAGK